MEEIYRSLLHIFILVILSVMVSAGCVAGEEDLSLEWIFNTSNVFQERTFGAGHRCPPTVFDLDGDGANEVIWGTRRGDSKRMWCISEDGELEWIYPPINQNGLPGDPTSKVSLVDVDGDGEYEAVFAGRGGVLHVIDGKGNLVWRWFNPYEGIAMHGPPQAFDVDGDGFVEFFINDMGGFLHRIDHEGNLVWTSQQNPDGNPSQPTIADVDQDGSYEIYLACQDHNVYAYSADDGWVLWTFDTGANMQANPVIVADVNSDEQYELVVWTDAPTSAVICLTCNGSELWRWILPCEGSIRLCQAMGDVDDDGNLDMVIMSSVGVFCIDVSGSSPSTKWEVNSMNFTEWSLEGRLPPGAKADHWSSYQLLADMDGDGSLEVLLLAPYPIVLDASTGELETYYLNKYIAVNRRQENGGWWGDVDNDGVSEWICELNGNRHPETQVYCLTMGGEFPAQSPWPEYYHSALPPFYQAEQGISLISAYSNSLWFPLEADQPGFFSVSVRTDRDWYMRGQTVTITARVTNASTKVLDAEVRYKVTRPDSSRDGPFAMYDDGTHGDLNPRDGVYTACYNVGQDHPAGHTYIEANATKGGLAISQRRTFQIFGYTDLGVHNMDTGEYFASIQEAIDDSDTVSGHTIVVESGTYHEKVVVNKPVHLKGLDTGTGKPVINGRGSGDIVTLMVDGITVERFEVTGSRGWRDAAIRVISSHNTITQNEVHGNDNAVYLDHSGMNLVTDNIFYDNKFHAVYLDQSNQNTIRGNKAEKGEDTALLVENSNNNTITNNSIVSNWYAIRLVSSNDNTICNNTASQCRSGIRLYASHNNKLVENRVNHNKYYGITLGESNYNRVWDNLIDKNNITGLRVDSSTGCVLKRNRMSGNIYNFWIGGSNHSHFNNQFDESNTVDGKPIHYLVGLSGLVIDSSWRAGTVYCINCTDMTMEGLSISNVGEGIFLYNTNNSVIRNNQVYANRFSAVSLRESNNNTVTDNTITQINGSVEATAILIESSNSTTIAHNLLNNSNYGIRIHYSKNTTILRNAISQCDHSAIQLRQTHDNKVVENTITESHETTDLYRATGNIIAGNNATDNRQGIHLHSSCNNTITKNIIQRSVYSGIKIRRFSNYNEVSWNILENNNDYGIYLSDADSNTITNNTAKGNKKAGICLRSSINNQVLDNTVSSSVQGIALIESQCNEVMYNTITNNGRTGIGIGDSQSNVIAFNHVASYLDGITITSSNHNRIYLNNFITKTGETVNQHSSENIWETERPIAYRFGTSNFTNQLGNYWGNYQGSDEDGNGVGDTTFNIDTDEDHHPLVDKFQEYILLEDMSTDLQRIEAECLINIAEEIIEKAKEMGMDTIQHEIFLQRAYEEFEKENYGTAKESALHSLSLKYKMGEEGMLTILFLSTFLLYKGKA